MARKVSKKFSKNDKKLLEKERQHAAQKKTNRTMSYVGIAIAILLILSMIMTTIRF
jgi:CHASE3 domain sensor protein